MKRLKPGLLAVRELPVRNDEEVDVAVDVCIPQRERALEVGAAETPSQCFLRAFDELPEQVVQVRIGGWPAQDARAGNGDSGALGFGAASSRPKTTGSASARTAKTYT